MTMASTPWLMKSRTAAICAAVSLSAALKVRSKPFSAENAVFIDSVLAQRQPDSEPVCAKPTVISLVPAATVAAVPAGVVRTRAAGRDEGESPQQRDAAEKTFFFMPKPPRSGPASLPALCAYAVRVCAAPLTGC